jgi:hypothetical protein
VKEGKTAVSQATRARHRARANATAIKQNARSALILGELFLGAVDGNWRQLAPSGQLLCENTEVQFLTAKEYLITKG